MLFLATVRVLEYNYYTYADQVDIEDDFFHTSKIFSMCASKS